MASQPWQTNASTRVKEFIKRTNPDELDVQAIQQAVRRLEIDPFDIPATKDHVGEWHYRIDYSASVPGHTLAMTYRIDRDFRYVDIISFEVYPAR